jgi:hypothetical protein
VLDGGPVPAVRDLKSRRTPSPCCSGALVQELIANDLVKGYRLFLHPLLPGTGKRLFRETSAQAAGAGWLHATARALVSCDHQIARTLRTTSPKRTNEGATSWAELTLRLPIDPLASWQWNTLQRPASNLSRAGATPRIRRDGRVSISRHPHDPLCDP